jgi:hypothetical protein
MQWQIFYYQYPFIVSFLVPHVTTAQLYKDTQLFKVSALCKVTFVKVLN